MGLRSFEVRAVRMDLLPSRPSAYEMVFRPLPGATDLRLGILDAGPSKSGARCKRASIVACLGPFSTPKVVRVGRLVGWARQTQIV